MTSDQLARLDLSGGPLCCGIHEALVQRLLLERKRLLEALTVAVALCEGAIYDVNGVPSGMLRAAIAFAEEAAR